MKAPQPKLQKKLFFHLIHYGGFNIKKKKKMAPPFAPPPLKKIDIFSSFRIKQSRFFRQHAASIYGFVRFFSFVSFFSQKKIRVSVRCITLWVRLPPFENMCVRSLGYIGGASPPPRVCPFIGGQSSLDPWMLPTPLCGIFTYNASFFLDQTNTCKLCINELADQFLKEFNSLNVFLFSQIL